MAVAVGASHGGRVKSLRLNLIDPPTEKVVQRAVVNFYRQLGCWVKSTSQARRSKVALGLPDLLVFWPAREAFWFMEVKRPGGKLSVDQIAFKALAADCGITVVVGGLTEAAKHIALIRGVLT